MHKFVCIHGHFYQPPRENPWLNAVEVQKSAYPFHDWNERITAECYSRNGASRILDKQGRIVDIINNYSRISFNFGPTLLEWIEKNATETYQAILQADKKSRERFSGHGSALAQCYNHMIMPLANARDQETQVIWGIKDFESRFKRMPEGMWLPETAVDLPTLEILAAHDIKFTILSPYQAKRVRRIGESQWQEVTGGKVDPRNAYLCQLPSGKKIHLFFYDGPVSQSIAFERLLNDGKTFANKLLGCFSNDDRPQLTHIATDGETYGHHHRFGEMALSFCLNDIETHRQADLTIYGEFLEKVPVVYEAEILENTAWSSTPRLERWMSEGGGHTGMYPHWHQKWRAPLRSAFNWVQSELIPLYETEMQSFVKDPWAVRNAFIEVILDRSHRNVDQFINRHTKNELSHAQKVTFLKLLEMQYHCMLMYTSCGWFFDEVSGIETLQDILYAARALQLATDINKKEYETELLKLLEKAPSNKPEIGNAAVAYEKFVKPSLVDLTRVGAHYAVSSLFSNYAKETKIYSFQAKSEFHNRFEAGKYKLVMGSAVLRSLITWEENSISYSVLHLGDHQIFGGISQQSEKELFLKFKEEMVSAFTRSDIAEVIYLMDKHFGMHNYSFWHLFRDDQQKIVDQVLGHSMEFVESLFGQIYDNNYPIMRAMNELNITLPKPIKIASDFIASKKLVRLLESESVDAKELNDILESLRNLPVELDEVTLNFKATERITSLIKKLTREPKNLLLMNMATSLLKAIKIIPLNPDLWNAQNMVFLLHKKYYAFMNDKSLSGEKQAELWCQAFRELYYELKMNNIEAR